jgi:hypothetical protein
VPQLLERTPQEAFEIVREDLGVDVAMFIRKRLWAEQIRRAEGDEFERKAAEVKALSAMSVDREELMRVIREERSRRGI